MAALQVLSPRADRGPSPSPAPISWPPSQYWDGDDGSWSSFALRVGNPGQAVRLLISTASESTWVVEPGGCPPGSPGKNPTLTCSQSRGIPFDYTRSSTWSGLGNYSLGVETYLGLDVPATYGLDTVALGFNNDSGGPTLGGQVVAGLQSFSYYTGLFGLGNQPTNLTASQNSDNLTGTVPHPSFLTTMKNQKLIPSLSWSYTAGANYRLKEGVFGSLTFGGYDLSRFIQNNVTFEFAPDISRDLVVGLHSITSIEADGAAIPLLSNSIYTFIDSTLPYIYLPIEACQAFEHAFGLTYSDTDRLYLVNDTLHESLTSRNPNFTFQIGNSLAGGQTVSIVLPYASFDLLASYPRVSNATRYFPLKRATNESQYTLGRTFLQEVYLIANYEYNNFSVSQANFDDSLAEQIVAIPAADAAPTTDSHSRISHKAIIGLSIGLFVGLLITCFLLYRLRKALRKDPSKRDMNAGPEFYQPSQEEKHPYISGIQEADNSSLRRELPDTGQPTMELFDKDSPSGSANKIVEMPMPESPSPTPLYELGTRHTSRATSSVRTQSDRNKAVIYVSTGIVRRETSDSSGRLKESPRVETKISSSPEHKSLSPSRPIPTRRPLTKAYLARALPPTPKSSSTRTSKSNASSALSAAKYAQSLSSRTSFSSSGPLTDNESILNDYASGWETHRRPEPSPISLYSTDIKIMMPPEMAERSMSMRGYPSMSSLSPSEIVVPPGTPVMKTTSRIGSRERGRRQDGGLF